MTWMTHLALGVSIAALAAGIAASLAAWTGRGGESPSGPRWGAALGLGVGVLLAHETVREVWEETNPGQAWEALRLWTKDGGAFPLSAGNAIHGLPWVVAAALLVGLLDADRPAPRWARWENRALLLALLFWMILGPLVGGLLEPLPAARWMIGLGVGLFAWWTLLDIQAERIGPGMPLVLLVTAAALPPVMIFSHGAMLAMLSVAFAVVLGTLWVVSWANCRMNLARGAVPIFAVNFSGLILYGIFYNDLAKPSALLLGLAPLASSVDRIGPVGRMESWKRATIRAVAVAIVAGAGVGWAYFLRPALEASEL